MIGDYPADRVSLAYKERVVLMIVGGCLCLLFASLYFAFSGWVWMYLSGAMAAQAFLAGTNQLQRPSTGRHDVR